MSQRIMAITLHQPWAWAIAKGHKDVENRDWRPHPGVEWLAIHVGVRPKTRKSADPERYTLDYIEQISADLREDFELDVPALDELRFGAIVAVARLAGVHSCGYPDPGRWRSDAAYGWLLADVVELAEPFPWKGAQGLWPLPVQAIAPCRKAVMDARRVSP